MKITHNENNEEKKIKRRRLESYQVAELEAHFNRDMYPTTEQKEDIARTLNLDTGVVSKWFINRRVKLRHEGAEIEAPKSHEIKRVSDKRTSGKSKRPEKSVPSKVVVQVPPHKLSALKRPAPRPPKQQRPPEVEPVSSSVIPVVTKPMDHTNRVQVITGKGKKGKPMSEANAKKEEEEFWKNWVESHPSTTEEPPTNPYFDYVDTKVKSEQEDEDYFESNEMRKTRKRKPEGLTSEIQTPLWKQLLQQHQETVKRSKVDINPILRHIWKMREEEDLPPFFAMLTGPTLVEPYRMEDLSVVLGRNTYRHRESDIHLGDNPMISHEHARIEFDREKMCYFIVNLSKNGFAIKHNGNVIECHTLYKRYPLSNPTVLNFQGIIVCFQIFMINPGPMSAAEKLKEQQARSRRGAVRGAKSYARMIEQALRKYRGQATYKEITDYIAKHCKDDILERKTWRNSVGGVLSTNSLFEAVIDSKDPKRGRGGLWRLRDVNRTESHNGPEKRPKKGEKTVHITLEPRRGEIIENSSTRDSEESYDQEISIDDEPEEFPIRTHRSHNVIEEDDEDEHLVIDDDPPPTETQHPYTDDFQDDHLINNNNIDFALMAHHGHVNPIHDISLREDEIEIDIGEGPDVPVIQSTGIKIDKDYSDEEEDDFDMDTPLHHQQQLFHQWQQMNSR